MLSHLKKRSSAVLSVILMSSILLAVFAPTITLVIQQPGAAAEQKRIETLSSRASSHGIYDSSRRLDPGTILGIGTDPQTRYPGIPWMRLSYKTCGVDNLTGDALKAAIRSYQSQGVRVLLLICQPPPAHLFDTQYLNDAAQGGADAVQCGNEEMKYDPPLTNYVAPQNFARFFDLCQRAVQAVRSAIPVILGSLDPRVLPYDIAVLMKQVRYLEAVQFAMNTIVHPGGKWNWRSQIVGLIDSWHNGYPNPGINNLRMLLHFWASQFHVSPFNGDIGKHLWVTEGTACFKGCGLNPRNNSQIAIAHIITLITDVSTAMRYHVPFFFFSGRDFILGSVYWPIGILNANRHPKPLRQDLPMGARFLVMTCSTGKVKVVDQEHLLATMYQGCRLPGNAYYILTH